MSKDIKMGNTAGAPSLHDIQAAAERIQPYAFTTPLLESPAINALVGGRVLIKPEVLQVTGSFKFRGACNRLLQLDSAQKRAGVVAFSSGNHALAVSAVARLLGIPATILMPSDAPDIKIAGTRANHADVRLFNRKTDDRAALAAEIVNATGAVLVPPFEDPAVIAGQGTVGLEIANALQAMGLQADAVLAPCSGGGLMAGIATAISSVSPASAVYAVEPEAFDDLARSLVSGRQEGNAPESTSICDALQVTCGVMTFGINQALLAGGLTVSDNEVRDAMRVAFRHLKLAVEPSGAVALAAILNTKIDVRGKTVVVVLSGGNVDAVDYARTLVLN